MHELISSPSSSAPRSTTEPTDKLQPVRPVLSVLHVFGVIELALVEERLDLSHYRRQSRRPASGRIEPLRNVLFGYADFAELDKNSTQRRYLDAFVAGDMGRQPFKLVP
jgi:hypothetical protein